MRRCWLSRTLALSDPCSYRADGRADRMHIGFTKTWLMHSPTGPHLDAGEACDERLLFDGCRKHHTALDAKRPSIPWELLPDSVISFAVEHDLLHKLEMSYPAKTVKEPGEERMGPTRPTPRQEG